MCVCVCEGGEEGERERELGRERKRERETRVSTQMWRSEDYLQGVVFLFCWDIWRVNSGWYFTGARPCHSDISVCDWGGGTSGTQRPRLTLPVLLWTLGAVLKPNLPRLVLLPLDRVARGSHF